MKKTIYILAALSLIFSCKKESSNSNSNTTTTNPAACVDNPNINFKSIGTPIGKFGDCIKDIEGNTYKTVTIGSQTWMAENLKVTKYNDGTNIINMPDTAKWNNATNGGWCYYNNDASNNIYGKLYNWYTISNEKVCPTGWHIPSNSEWVTLVNYLGGNSTLIDGDTIVASKLKETGTIHWVTPNNANNLSLFSALPAGARESDGGSFEMLGQATIFLSSDILTTSGFDGVKHVGITNEKYGNVFFFKTNDPKRAGYSIRCIKN